MTGKIDYCLIAAGTIGALATLVGALAHSNPVKSIWIMLVIIIIIIIVVQWKPPNPGDPPEEATTSTTTTANVLLIFLTFALGIALTNVVFLNPQQLPPAPIDWYKNPIYWYNNPIYSYGNPITGPIPPGPGPVSEI
jgi:hypothetical protein